MVGNFLGQYVELDLSYEDTNIMCVGKILVNLNLREGLVESIILHKGEFYFIQDLDYQGMHFKCNKCHSYGYVVLDCSISLKNNS